jgi:molecular chaperone GrpE
MYDPDESEGATEHDAAPEEAGASESDAGARAEEGEAAEPIDLREARIQELEGQLKEAMGRLRAISKAYSDQKDEMSSFRERTEAQAKIARARREFDVVKAFFDPVQNLQRSVSAVQKAIAGGVADPAVFLEGIQMIHHQFMEGLVRLGLQPIPGVGSSFDPNLHEAIAVTPVADAALDGKVQFVHMEGFMVDGRPLQPAQVVIGKFEGGAVGEA